MMKEIVQPGKETVLILFIFHEQEINHRLQGYDTTYLFSSRILTFWLRSMKLVLISALPLAVIKSFWFHSGSTPRPSTPNWPPSQRKHGATVCGAPSFANFLADKLPVLRNPDLLSPVSRNIRPHHPSSYHQFSPPRCLQWVF